MDLGHLHVFCTVLETGSISNAARKLFVSQPTISMKISELEEHYQVKLLERTNKGVKPTEEGLFVYREGQKLLSMAQNMERQLNEKKDCCFEELHVGSSSTFGGYILPCRIMQFQDLNPHYRINLNIRSNSQVLAQLLAGTIDVGFVEGSLPSELVNQCHSENLVVELLAEDELVVVTSKLAPGKDTIEWSSFEMMPLILKSKGSGIRTVFDLFLAQNHLSSDELNIVLELNRINALVSAVASGKGVSLLPRAVLSQESLKQIRFEEHTIKYNYYIIYNPKSTCSHDLMEFLKKYRNDDASNLTGIHTLQAEKMAGSLLKR